MPGGNATAWQDFDPGLASCGPVLFLGLLGCDTIHWEDGGGVDRP
jgi:hypothetical protein